MARAGAIRIRVSPNAVRRVADEIGAEIDKLNRFSREFAGALADAVAERAQENFEYAAYDGVNDARVYVNQDKRNRYTVVAEGQSVPFIEYGTGVEYNEPYPGDVPARFSGRYGKGHGEEGRWWFEWRPGVETSGPDGNVFNTSRLAPKIAFEYDDPETGRTHVDWDYEYDENAERKRVYRTWVFTRGNAPNACMYDAFKATIEEDFNDILDEVRDAEL